MKNLSSKLMVVITLLILAGISVDSFWINIAAGLAALIMIVFIHLDNVDFCAKLDRVSAGEKNVKF